MVSSHDSSNIQVGALSSRSPLTVFWDFLVPYTFQGVLIFSISRVARVVVNSPQRGQLLNLSLLIKIVSGLLCVLCSNSFTAGINQLYDIEIDKINKPYKPLPSGDMSVETAWALTLSYVVLGLGIIAANKAEPWVVFCYCFGLFLGGAYSTPPIRFKRFPILASLLIGFSNVNASFGIYRALKATLPFPTQWTASLSFITTFHFVLFCVLGIIKDIPDIEGDRKHQIFTPAAALGPRKTAFLGAGVVLLLYIGGMGASIVMAQSFNTIIMIPSHTILALLLIYRVWVLHKNKYAPNECEHFYRFLWSLLCLENFIFPFI